MTATRRNSISRRASALGAAALVITITLGLPTTAPAAHAEACTSTGLQPRLLETDVPGRIETQFCVAGAWTTTSIDDYAVVTRIITERVTDPLDSHLALSKAEAFFGVKSIDPYATITDAQKLLDAAIKPSELVELRVALVDARAQALKNRQSTGRADGCRTRSRTYSWAELVAGTGWGPPRSTGPTDQPSQIDFAFSPQVTGRMKVVILTAVDQYEAAVAGQDAAARYPSRLVQHDPSDPRPPTILFDVLDDDDEVLGLTHRVSSGPGTAASAPWLSGEVRLVSGSELVPAIVGHEIGHVLGLDDLPGSQHGVMRGSMEVDSDGRTVWGRHIGTDHQRDVAFDQCMFLPPMEPVL